MALVVENLAHGIKKYTDPDATGWYRYEITIILDIDYRDAATGQSAIPYTKQGAYGLASTAFRSVLTPWYDHDSRHLFDVNRTRNALSIYGERSAAQSLAVGRFSVTIRLSKNNFETILALPWVQNNEEPPPPPEPTPPPSDEPEEAPPAPTEGPTSSIPTSDPEPEPQPTPPPPQEVEGWKKGAVGKMRKWSVGYLQSNLPRYGVSDWTHPVDPQYTVSSAAGSRTSPITGKMNSGHMGIDIAGPIPNGSSLYSMAAGTVTYINSSISSAAGWYVEVFHGMHEGRGVYTRMLHTRSKGNTSHREDQGDTPGRPLYSGNPASANARKDLLVSAGDVVTKGQQIGYIGSTGGSTGNHLHIELILSNYGDKGANGGPKMNKSVFGSTKEYISIYQVGGSEPVPPAAALGPADADPNAAPGVKVERGNYVITVMTGGGTGGTKKVLWIGDSQSDGTSLSRDVKKAVEAAGGQMDILAKYGKGLVVGSSYWGHESASGRLPRALNTLQPNLVIVELGGNDSYKYAQWKSSIGSPEAKAQYMAVIESYLAAIQSVVPGVEVRLFGPSYASKPGYDPLRQRIRTAQKTYVQGAGAAGLSWHDMVPFTRNLEGNSAGDGVHFSSNSYKSWAQSLLESSVLKDLREPGAPQGEGTPEEVAKNELARFLTNSANATAANINITGDLNQMSSDELADGRVRTQYAIPTANATKTSTPPAGGGAYGRGTGAPASGGGRSTPAKDKAGKELAAPAEINIEPIDFQCVLLEHIRKLSNKHNSATAYGQTTKVNTEGSPGEVLTLIHHGGQTDETRQIMNLCPDVYGTLVPYLKISRVDYNKLGKVIDEKQLKIPNFISPSDVEEILAGRKGRTSGAGVKSFKWDLKGVQPAEVDNNITATLVIYFQSIGDFFQGATQAGGDEPNFLDLIINSRAVREVRAKASTDGTPSAKPSGKGACPVNKAIANSYDGARFRIKVCAGWSAPDNLEEIFPTMAAGDVESLKRAIASTRVSLFLQQVSHGIDFNENGSILLTVEYHAAISGLLRGSSADIFIDGKNMDQIEEMRNQKRELDKEANEEGMSSGQVEKLGKQTDELLKQIDKLEQEDKLAKYRKLLNGLFESNKIMILELPTDQVYTKSISDMTPAERLEHVRMRQGTKLGKETLALGELEQSIIDSIPEEGGSVDDTSGKIEKQQKKDKKSRNKRAKKKKGHVQIPFMYLGDIIENVIIQMKKNNGGPLDFRFFLSEVDLIDPLVAFQVKSFADYASCGNLKDAMILDAMEAVDGSSENVKENLFHLTSIGSIPISLDAFQKWFTDNVIKKSIDKYYFLNFIKDISAQLISNALRSQCYGKKFKFYQRFDAQPLSLSGAKTFPKGGETSVTSLAKAKAKLTCESAADDSILGIVLVSNDSKPRNLQGDYESDLKRGIYHNYIGSSCGLVKKVTFNREDQPYMRESKIQRHGELGAEQLRELYSVNIDLVGNNLYRNGAYVYVSPLLLDSTMEELEYLGLHGYYLITSVSSILTETSFKTTMRGLHEGVKFPNAKLASDSKPTLPPAPSDNKTSWFRGEEGLIPDEIQKPVYNMLGGNRTNQPSGAPKEGASLPFPPKETLI